MVSPEDSLSKELATYLCSFFAVGVQPCCCCITQGESRLTSFLDFALIFLRLVLVLMNFETSSCALS